MRSRISRASTTRSSRRGKHVLKGTAWRSKLCVPDPCLTFTEAEELAKGKSAANQKIAEMVTRLTS